MHGSGAVAEWHAQHKTRLGVVLGLELGLGLGLRLFSVVVFAFSTQLLLKVRV